MDTQRPDKIICQLYTKMLPYQIRTFIRKKFKRIHIFWNDISNKVRYGSNAPIYLETIWINPNKVDSFIPKEEILRITGKSRKEASGEVVNWTDVSKIIPLENDFRYRYAFERWRDGKSWEEIGVFEYMKNETKKYKDMSRAQLEERYREFDLLFEDVKKEGRLKPRTEVDPTALREENGILIHIGEGGKFYFGGVGFHRFSIAKVLELNEIPACIGIVDKNSIHYLKKFRKM